jgi:hypothetical protein
MKRLLSILFLFIFLFNLSGYFIVFKIEEFAIEREMKAYIKKNISDIELEKVIIADSVIASSSCFRYTEENEFVYNGKYYDVVRKTSDIGMTIFFCINDSDEEKLFESLQDYIRQNSDQDTPSRNKSVNLEKNIIKEALPDDHPFCFCSFSSKNSCFSYDSILTDQDIPVYSPPPKA